MKEYQLGDLLDDIVGGGTPSKRNDDYWEGGTIPWASVKDMPDGKYRLQETEDHITKEGLQNSSTNLIPKGTVITSTRMGLGRSFINEVDMAINQDLKALFPNRKLHNEFLLWWLASKANELESIGTGTTVKGIRLEQLRALRLNLPDIKIQQKIASILSSFDDLIENNSRRIEILEEMARRIYREWFVYFRYPGHKNDELVDSGTELGEVPEGWEVKKLEELCELTLGQSPKSEFYNEKGEGLPFHQGVRDFGDRYPTTTTWCVKEKRIAEEGDILFSVRAPVGRINIANTKMIIGRGLHSIRSKLGNQVFIFHQLKDKFQEEDSMGSGTIYKSVTKKIMLNLKLINPGKELIEKFEEKVVPIFNQIKVLTNKNEKLKETRDLLLPKLISGKIDVEEIETVKQ